MDRPRGKRTRKKILLLLGLSLGSGLVLLELALRFVLFTDLARSLGIGWRLRNEALYAPREAGRANWKLRRLFEERAVSGKSPYFHPRLGWLRVDVDPVSFAHADESLLAGRRPVLLFGDSYAQCVLEAGICWEDLLGEDPLGADHALLNYGVGGYGVDQMRLLMEPVLERFQERKPVVVVGILVDDDLDRCYLGLRGYPKPYYTLDGVADGAPGGSPDGTELVLHPVEHADAFDYLRAHPVGITSYVWRWVLFGSGWVTPRKALAWTDEADHIAEKQGVNRRLLEEMRDTLRSRGLEHFFVLFHARRSLEGPGLYRWQEPFLHETLAALDLPFVSSRRFLQARLAAGTVALDDLYLPRGPGMNHYTAAANTIVFDALRAGLRGEFEAQGTEEGR